MELNGRIAVVTGGASGIGAAVAKDLAADGARVVTWDRTDSADVTCDIREPATVEAAMRQTLREAGVPTTWVMAAGINGRAPFVDTPLEDWDRIFDVNVRGTYVCMREAARAMIEAGTGGSMVLLSSTSGTLSDPASVPYSVSKAGVIHLAKVAAVELGQYGIRVNAVAPGPTETPMTARNLDHPEYRQLVIDTTPLGQVGTPELLSNGIVGLLKMDWVTGQLLVVDGGTSLVTPRGVKRASYGAFAAGAKYVQST
jgi:NAD(P)-dependent dehydrogenase (short-subunit alcohol dehydrogenase family)